MKQLLSVHVYQPQGVSVSWKFRFSWGVVISGRTEKGRVMLATEADILKIYLISEDMDIGCPPLELNVELSIFCGMKNPDTSASQLYFGAERHQKNCTRPNRREVPDKIPEDTEIDPVVKCSKF